MHLRPAGPEDAVAWVRVVLAASPLFVLDEGSERHEMATEPASVRRLVAEVDETVVGVARFRPHPEDGHAGLTVMVHPHHRRRGTGRALVDAMVAHLRSSGLARALSVVEDDADSRPASARLGFTPVRELRMATVDPRTVPPPPLAPEGVRVVPVGEVGPRAVWQAHQRVARDDPSGLTLPQPYDEWLAGEWEDPRMRPDLGRAALVGDTVAAYSLLGCAGDRAWSAMTGTVPEQRGRGLALLTKQHALVAAVSAGVRTAATGNDAANAPMLAVNRRLGYRPAAAPFLAERLR